MYTTACSEYDDVSRLLSSLFYSFAIGHRPTANHYRICRCVTKTIRLSITNIKFNDFFQHLFNTKS